MSHYFTRKHAENVYFFLVQHRGQVYIPLINYLLMTLCLIIVGTFQTSTNIGRAYGESATLASNRAPRCTPKFVLATLHVST